MYQFDGFQLDVAEQALFRDGQPVPLTPKVFEILLTLVENSGRTVTKEELMGRVWPDSFVEEGNLTQNISVLRKALGDGSGTTKCIETVPRRGYRFNANVQEFRDDQYEMIYEERTQARVTIEEEASEQGNVAAAAPGRRRLLPGAWQQKLLSPSMLVAGGGVAIMILLTVWLIGRHGPPPPALEFRTLYGFNSKEGQSIKFARFSPAGSEIAYVVSGQGFNLYIIGVGGNEPRQITSGDSLDESPVWSPDGSEIAFVSNRNNQTGIWKVSSGGGEPRILIALSPETTGAKLGRPKLSAWRDRTIYYEWRGNLYTLDTDSLKTRNLTGFDPETYSAMDFAVSSDGQIAYTNFKGGRSDLWVISAEGGEPYQITKDQWINTKPIWLPDNKGLIYASLRDGRNQICRIDLSGKQSRLITAEENSGWLADLSADGHRVLYYANEEKSDVLAVDVATGITTTVAEGIEFECWPSVSHDGKKVAWQIFPRGNALIPWESSLISKSVGTEEKETLLAANSFEARWSPDSDNVIFLRRKGKSFALYIRESDGQEKQLAENITSSGYANKFAFNLAQTNDFTWSRDNRIAYCAVKDGFQNVFVIGPDDTEGQKISDYKLQNANVYCPTWSRDSSQLAWVYSTGPSAEPGRRQFSIWVTDFRSPRCIFGPTEDAVRLVGWTPDDRIIIASVENKGVNQGVPAKVWLSSVSVTGKPADKISIGDSDSTAYFSNIHLSPDGRSISMIVRQGGKENIRIISLTDRQSRQVTRNDDSHVYLSSMSWSPDNGTIYFGRQTRECLLKVINNFN
ncbi:MAG TPA: winged helix-turn-helix domain-containing protein [Blastocatellia bacterium]|nr:winged helix-turn-helix domain-containing protein [Blastocatellia bacterium]